jgi:hypothetical protein
LNTYNVRVKLPKDVETARGWLGENYQAVVCDRTGELLPITTSLTNIPEKYPEKFKNSIIPSNFSPDVSRYSQENPFDAWKTPSAIAKIAAEKK